MEKYRLTYQKPYQNIKYDEYGYADGYYYSDIDDITKWTKHEIIFESKNNEEALKMAYEYMKKNIMISEGKKFKPVLLSLSLISFKVVKLWKHEPMCADD